MPEQNPCDLSEQHELLRVTLASIGDAVITTDNDGRVTYLNPVAQRLTGWTLEEARGAALDTIFRIVNEETRHSVENPAARSLREGLIVGLANHTLLIAKDGVERPIDDSAAPIKNDRGEVVGVVLVFRDVSQRRNAEQALRASEERFRLLVEGTQDYAIFMLDPQGNVASWNPGAERIKGFRADEIIGRHFSVFYPNDPIATGWPQRELEMAAQQGRFEDEGWRLRKDGTRFWANVVITALHDKSGQLKGFSKITRDLTERRMAESKLRQSELKYRLLFETARDGILVLDAETGKITDANPFMEELSGYTKDELLGKELWQIGLPHDAEAGQAIVRRLQERGHIRHENLALETKNGRRVDVVFTGNIYETDTGQAIHCNVRDVTDRRQLERARIQAEDLAGLNRRKDEFLAMLSHELRNPLAPIMNAVQLLELKAGEHATPLEREARSIILRQVAQLKVLIDDLLEVSRITAGRIRLNLESADVRRIVNRAVEVVRPLIEQRRHELLLTLPPEPVWLYADPARLEQVVVNLLTNAAKYTDLGGRIVLDFQHTDREAVLRVRDTGVGIAPDLLPRIFDLFTQAERSLDRSQGGLGIGLTLVQRLVSMHGGTVAVASELGKGSEFVVRLPVWGGASAPPEAPARPIAATPPATLAARLRVLVVDDNVDAAECMAMLVKAAGHDVRLARDGPAGLNIALDYRPNVALLDIGLPGMDGYELAGRLRQHPDFRHTVLVALTGYGRETDLERSPKAGFDYHLLKPADIAKVRTILANVAKRAATECPPSVTPRDEELELPRREC